MAKEERLFAEDEIRPEDSDQWVLAQTVPGLFSESADEDDLSSLLESAGESTSADSDSDAAKVSGWYCRTRTDELGPMPFGRLVGLARNGKLARRDQVRQGVQGTWVEARSIDGLFEETPPTPTAEPAPPESAMLEGFEIVPDTTEEKPRPPRPKLEPILKMEDDPASLPDTEAEWTCRVLGQVIGPITWDDLRELVETRQIGPNDRVRKANAVAWVPAGDIDNLFPKRKKKRKQQRLVRKKKKNLSDDDVLDILQPDEEPEEEDEEEYSSHLAPQRSYAPTQKKSTPATPVRPQAGAASPAGAAPSAGEPPTPSESPAPSASPPPPGSPPPAQRPDLAAAIAAASSPRPGTVPPPQRPAPKREKRKMGNPFAGLGGSLEDLQDALATSWKPVAGVVAALLLVGAVIYGGVSLFSSSTGPIYEQTAKMWDLAEKHRRTENETGWEAFNTRYVDRIADMAAKLEEEGSSDPLAQLLLTCTRDLFPKMLEAPITGASDTWDEMGKKMDEAQSLYGGG